MPVAAVFPRIAIVGTGLIGGSFALAVRKELPAARIVGWDRPETVARAHALGAIDESAETLASALRDADLVYIALPANAALDFLPAIAEAAKPGALVTDACSSKAVVCKLAQQHFTAAGSARFLGGHPLAGKESSGIERANANLLRGARYALIGSESDDNPDSDPRVRNFADLLRTMGAQPVWCDADTHDWAVGVVSHLPQLAAVALARVVLDELDETGLPLTLAGSGLRDTLRLAGSPYSVWRDVCLTNTDNIQRTLDRFSQAIDHLRNVLRSRELEDEFDAANGLYKILNNLQ
jgi:prephenate dehydrogenase